MKIHTWANKKIGTEVPEYFTIRINDLDALHRSLWRRTGCEAYLTPQGRSGGCVYYQCTLVKRGSVEGSFWMKIL